MKRAIAASFAPLFGLMVSGTAMAGDWQWGCMGPIGNEQILFNRGALIIAPGKPPLGELQTLFRAEDLTTQFRDAEGYNADDDNSGFQKTMTFTSQDNPKTKLTLTEKSSKTISHKHHLVCGRDEDTSVETKVYRVERPGEAATDVTLQCREYLLTTKGGRPCISD